jgi:hypothetical protein
MPRGGHGKSGPAPKDAATRALHGSRTRAQHKTKGDAGAPMILCDPPPDLSKSERKFWAYYAPQLVAEGRLTLKARDTLAKYCTSLAVVAGLRKQLESKKREDVDNRSNNRKELRQWILASRLYENDLLLNPSSSIRAPKPGGVDPPVPNDPMDAFDDEAEDDATVN